MDTQIERTQRRCINCNGPIVPSTGKGRRRLYFCGTSCRLDHWQKVRSEAERIHLKQLLTGDFRIPATSEERSQP